ncbi:MAG: aminodeoxychorismate/anthranilate synthase component II [Gemmatimonadaceae bacterium]
MVLVIDNYDSFTYNLVQYLGALGENPVVRRNDAIDMAGIGAMQPTAIVISPGPGVPKGAGISLETITTWGDRIPILGVCLGHQAIGEAYGGHVVRADHTMHGKTSLVRHEGDGLFETLPSPLRVMRYHSLVVERASLPSCLRILAVADDDEREVHAVQHTSHPVWGVQFHPESIMTEGGSTLLANFLRLAATFHRQPRAA